MRPLLAVAVAVLLMQALIRVVARATAAFLNIILSVAVLMLISASPELEVLLIILLLQPLAWTIVIGVLLALTSQGKRSLTILGVREGHRLCVGCSSFIVDPAL